nr:hypothetical protein [Clostridia bacterium]
MKKHIAAGLIFVLCAVLIPSVLLLENSRQSEAWDNSRVKICLERGEGFTTNAHLQEIDREGDAIFQIWLQEDYEIIDCSYPDYALDQGDGYTLLTLKNVRYADRVTLRCEIPTSVINYDPNGGCFSENGSAEPLRIAYGPSAHPRINTLSGQEKLLREGYVMVGWNTAADGSGDHIGLGSRVTVEKNAEMTLYAQWMQETPQVLFTWVEADDGLRLTACLGVEAASLVIPGSIDGRPVTAIAAGFAQGLSIDSLVIPDSVLRIEEGAFRDCAIEHIYFFDTLRQVSDASFAGSRPRYWHIGAVVPPRYQGASDITAFADKMDLLLLHQDEQKLLLFAGCSMNYGMDSSILAEAFPEYTVLNLGAVGGTNAQFQFACMLPYLRSGDVFIHAPEQASAYQLMSSTACENRMFIAVEGNFDLLAQVDMTTLGAGAFDCFRAFNEKRSFMEVGDYADQYIPLNAYGDNIQQRLASNQGQFDEDYGLLTELITENGLDLLAAYYDRIRAAGAEVYLSYAPINALCCEVPGQVAAFAEAWEQGMQARGYETISDLKDYVMEPKYFYDADYHLTTAGAALRAQQLCQDLQPILTGDGE